jgi:hypothetical protein
VVEVTAATGDMAVQRQLRSNVLLDRGRNSLVLPVTFASNCGLGSIRSRLLLQVAAGKGASSLRTNESIITCYTALVIKTTCRIFPTRTRALRRSMLLTRGKRPTQRLSQDWMRFRAMIRP